MTHDEIKILISAYTDGEVTPSEKNIVEEHLKTCASCQKDVQMYKAMSSSLSKWPSETLSPDEEIKMQRRFEQRRGPMFTQRTMMALGTTLALTIIIGSTVQTYLKSGVQVRLKSSSDAIYEHVYSKNSSQYASIRKAGNFSVVQGRLKSAADDIGEQYSSQPEVTNTTSNAVLLNTQQEYWGNRTDKKLEQKQYLSSPVAPMPVPMAQQMPQLASAGPAASYEPYYLQSNYNVVQNSIENKRLGYGLIGADASVMRTRFGAQQAGYSPNVYSTGRFWADQPVWNEGYNAPTNTEDYDRIYENPFVNTKVNPFSTFSISVDTGSYSNIRRFLNNGQLPPRDAVQTEELINYFSYDYPQPTGDRPFSITAEVSACPWNLQHQLALIGLQGKNISMEKLPASNLVFLVDISGSMGEEDKLPLVKSSLHLLVEQLRPEDTVSIVVFSGAAQRLLEPTSGRDKNTILNAIDSLQAGGSTNGEDGLQLAYQMAQESFIPDGNNRIIVTTDGDFNVGTSDDGELMKMIEEKKDDGVYLTVFGFGMGNIKASRMEKLADAGHGNYDYIDSLDEARKQFEQQLTGTLYGIAKDVKIQVKFNPATVKAYRLIGYEKRKLNKADFNNDQKDAGVLGAGHTVTALYEITPAEPEESSSLVGQLGSQLTSLFSSNDLMTVNLRYKDPQSDSSKLISGSVNKWQVNPEPSENLRFAGAVAEFGMLLRDSKHKGNASYSQVMDTVQNAMEFDNNGYRKDFLDLIQKASLLGPSSTSPIIPYTPSISPDGSVLNAGTYGALVTRDGAWTLSPATCGAGNMILLNGQQADNGWGVLLLVNNNGQLYTYNRQGMWFVWNGSNWNYLNGNPSYQLRRRNNYE